MFLPRCRNALQVGRSFSVSATAHAKAALVLAGNGVYDGSECTEVVAALVHLSRTGVDVSCYAPDKDQAHTVDHTAGTAAEDGRNVMVESARLTRGAISPLAALDSAKYDCLVIPGGFGAAKNLSNFAFADENTPFEVDADVARAIADFHGAGKPIALCCIAPVLAAKTIPGVEVTVGKSEGDAWPHAAAAAAIASMGATHVEKEIGEVHVDIANRVVTAPAYMYDGQPHEIFDSVGAMVDELVILMME